MSYNPPASILTAPYYEPRFVRGYYVDGSRDMPMVVGLAAIPSDSEVDLSWTALPDDNVVYKIKRSEVSEGPYTVLDDIITDAVYIDSTVINDTEYFYVVSATLGSMEGQNSAEVSATPVAVEGP